MPFRLAWRPSLGPVARVGAGGSRPGGRRKLAAVGKLSLLAARKRALRDLARIPDGADPFGRCNGVREETTAADRLDRSLTKHVMCRIEVNRMADRTVFDNRKRAELTIRPVPGSPNHLVVCRRSNSFAELGAVATRRRPFGHAWRPLMQASAMIPAIFRWTVARDQRSLPAAFAGVERSAWTRSRARSSPGGTGTSRQRSVRRFQVRIRIEAASRSNVGGSNDQGFGDLDTGIRQNERKALFGQSWFPGSGCEEALALIGGDVLAAADINKLKVADQAIHFAARSVRSCLSAGSSPAWASWSCGSGAVAPCRGSRRAGRETFCVTGSSSEIVGNASKRSVHAFSGRVLYSYSRKWGSAARWVRQRALEGGECTAACVVEGVRCRRGCRLCQCRHALDCGRLGQPSVQAGRRAALADGESQIADVGGRNGLVGALQLRRLQAGRCSTLFAGLGAVVPRW